MGSLLEKVQEVVVAGGFVCFWVGATRDSAQLFSIGLNGTVPEASNNGTAVALLLTAHVTQERVRVTWDDANNRVTKVECKRATVDLMSVADQYPYVMKGAMGDYAPRIHNHDDRYSVLGHNHDAAYSPLGHNHDAAYSPQGHNHDGAYSPLGHNHNGAYSPLGHNHDGAYSPLGHNHDAAYSPQGHNHDHQALTNRFPREHTLAIETRLTRGVPLGTPLRELLLSDAEFAALRTELGAGPLAAYTARNGISGLSAMVVDGGVFVRTLSVFMERNTAAADLRWSIRLFNTNTDTEYTRPTLGSTEDVILLVTTHLNAP